MVRHSFGYKQLGLLAAFVALLTQLGACTRPLDPQADCNFVQSPEMQRVSWNKNLPVKLYLNNSIPVDAYGAIDRAVAEFNNQIGKEVVRVMARNVDGGPPTDKDGYSTIYWFSNWESDRKTEQARTTIYWTGSQIFEADIRINAVDFKYYTGTEATFTDVDLTSLIVHELGHVLGLVHTSANGSVMSSTLDSGVDRRHLSPFDLSSLKCEY